MGKRAASGASAAKKVPTEFEIVTAILTEFETSKGSAKAILSKALPKASGLERTDEQEQARDQVFEALTSARQQVVEKQVPYEAQLQEVNAAVAQLEAAASAAASEAGLKQQALATQEESLKEAKAEHATIIAEHAKAEKSGKTFTKRGDKLREETSRYAAAVETLAALLQGLAPEGSVKLIISALEGCGPEQALLAAALGALELAPDARGTFDKLTIDSVNEVLTSRLHELQKELADRKPEEASQQAELLGLWALADVEREKNEALEQALEKAKAELVELRKSLTETRKQADNEQKGMTDILVQKTLDEAKVAEIDKVLAIFDRLAAAEVVVPEPVAEDVVMEAVDAADQANMEVDEAAAKDLEAESSLSKSPAVSHGNALHLPTPMVA